MKIVFTCSGNTCRSPMAQAVFAGMAKGSGIGFVLSSAGVSAQNGAPASENAIKACKELGLDLNSHKSKSILDENLETADLFVAMTMTHAQALMNLGVKQDKIYILNVSDPFGGSLQAYRDCLEEITQRLIILLELIKRQEKNNG